MIEIPIGKALIAVEVEGGMDSKIPSCKHNECKANTSDLPCMACHPNNRKDGKNVIFKIVDIDGTIRKPIRRESDEKRTVKQN